MHIELTDHLRCPEQHAEAFVVLLPDRVDQRRVLGGHLGCPVCGWGVAWTDGIPDFGDAIDGGTDFPFDASAAVAMLGIDGPGGWVATSGSAGMIAPGLATLLPGVRIVAVNPPRAIESSAEVSVVRSGAWPVKTASMRGVVIGHETADPATAVRSALPGLRACGAGNVPADETSIELVASAGDAWVVRVR